MQLGINFLSDKCDRYFLMHADRPLVDPDTLQKMKAVDADVVVPVHNGKQGQPLLLKSSCPIIGDMESISRLTAVMVDVEDPGILIPAEEAVYLYLALIHSDFMLCYLAMISSVQ